MTLHPEDVRYWTGWAIGLALVLLAARLALVQPIVDRLDRILGVTGMADELSRKGR